MNDEQVGKKEIIVRPARPEDYPEYRQMEEKVFAGTNVPLLEKEMFLEWIRVHSEGFVLGVVDGNICGHMYAQICDYDPFNHNDNRNIYELTDNMWTTKSHNPDGNCVYPFSICSTLPGVGKKINNYFLALTKKLKKEYYAGPIYMPGLANYVKKMNRKRVTKNFVQNYAQLVADTVAGKNTGENVIDPVVTPVLRFNNMLFARVIKDFWPYHKNTDRWGCVVYFNNL